MGLSKLAMNKYVDEVVAYEFCNNKVIRYKSKQAGESDNLIWEIEKATSIEFIGALSQAKCHKLKEYIYQNCEYIESPLKELWVKDNIEIKGLEKEIKKKLLYNRKTSSRSDM